MLIVSVEIMKTIDGGQSVIQGVLQWDEVIEKCN